MIKKLSASIVIIAFFLTGNAQESLLSEIEDTIVVRQKVSAAFKSTRVINAHSVEMLAKRNLDFRILHRFGPVSGGINNWFGLDNASMRMGFDYGITNDFMIGVGRSTSLKEVDGYVKTRIFQQSTGERPIPFSLVVAAGALICTMQSLPSDPVKPDIKERTSYYVQLIAGRKFSETFSFQLSPVILHRNMVDRPVENNTLIALGGGARYKLSKRIALTIDYHQALSGIQPSFNNPLSIGMDIETGGHVFQLHFSNAAGMNERAYITETNNKFFDGEVRFGFNLSRIFKLGRKK